VETRALPPGARCRVLTGNRAADEVWDRIRGDTRGLLWKCGSRSWLRADLKAGEARRANPLHHAVGGAPAVAAGTMEVVVGAPAVAAGIMEAVVVRTEVLGGARTAFLSLTETASLKWMPFLFWRTASNYSPGTVKPTTPA
jgi:hypothetical protein